ncbi:hypothetical protein WN55_09302 [Dufourea novaeangliae]|uniref:Uncharacterized protein n=1 Tax=Dufourea novaeangliae TaxID=178035 RepID=A0A154PAZ6_DUFNO|nr:hypothetical protein WN55_09302 [Dufourea novaeangliae]
MGQAWCKEKSSKAEDSKSPLDRVFVRCAHRIYPSLKEEGSVLGGATQRVTSSEIGYAGSPPREVLTRGRSIDSVDRPFHPSEWVDVNLEVPSTPRPSSALTNLTVDTSLYPATTPTSSYSTGLERLVEDTRSKRRDTDGSKLGRPEVDDNRSERSDIDDTPETLGTPEIPTLQALETPDTYSHIPETPKTPWRMVSRPLESQRPPRSFDSLRPLRPLGHSKHSEFLGFPGSNLKDATPVPPPRRKKRNKGRPLPPKPDEIAESSPGNSKRAETGDEPLYSSVRSPKSSGDEQDADEEAKPDDVTPQVDPGREGRRTKEIYEHKASVNGTGRIISSDVVSGKRASHIEDRKSGRTVESDHHHRRAPEAEEYDRFARSRTTKDSSTPNREEKWASKEAGKRIVDTSRDTEKSTSGARTKNYSTVSLPNYDELDVTRHLAKGAKGGQADGDRTKSRRPVRSSTGSLPAESFLAPFSEKTSVRLEDYIPRRGSPDNLPEYQVLEKLDCGPNDVVDADFVKYDPSKSEDWDLEDGVDNCELNHEARLSFEDEDVVDFVRRSPIDLQDAGSPVCLQKPEAFGKTPSPSFGGTEYSEVNPNRSHLRYFDPPTLEDSCRDSTACDISASKEPFFLDEAKHRSALDTIVGDGRQTGTDRSDQTRTIFGRRLSNESEPDNDAYESKELATGRPASLIRTISEESLPREMLEQQVMEEFFDEKLAKDTHNKLRKCLDDHMTKTPPPSPEPRIKPEILDNDHSTLLKVLKDDAADESNVSSMTPSLTELEAALSDMLEQEEPHEGVKDREGKMNNGGSVKLPLPVGSGSRMDMAGANLGQQITGTSDDHSQKEGSVSLGQILETRKPITNRKVSFCAWEETLMKAEDDREFIERPTDLDKDTVSHPNDVAWGVGGAACATDLPPEKPSRLNRNLEDLMENPGDVPTPPRRRHRTIGKRELEVAQNGSAMIEQFTNDRLI